MKKIYFAGSIRGGRNDLLIYKKIINHLQLFGEVLTEHVGDASLTSLGEVEKSSHEIYARDLDWLTSAEFVVADVSTPSLGVGFEIAKALELNKKVLCLYRIQEDKRLSAMLTGCPNIQISEYQIFEDVQKIIDDFFAI